MRCSRTATRPLAGFPRRNRRGLIEASLYHALIEANQMGFPRRNRRGLIEAPPTSASGSCSPVRFPRRNRRGLIEAPTPATLPSSIATVFPGGIAGASLKQVGGEGDARLGLRFPRRNRRGLIEARGAVEHPANPAASFPRRNRRGLIEAGRCRTSIREGTRVFPGGIAGASLKLELPPVGHLHTPKFSPAESPGPH